MNTTPKKRQAIEVAAAAVIVLVAGFLPWGEVDFRRMTVPADIGGGMGEALAQMVAAFGVVPVTLWNGHADLGGIKLPNVLVLFAALAASLVTWLRAASVGSVPARVAPALAGYGLAHSTFVMMNLGLSAEGSVRIGVVVTSLAFVWMVLALLRRSKPVGEGGLSGGPGKSAEPGASPNGGPVPPIANSGATEGPPSVS
jgi:hypothetical protein